MTYNRIQTAKLLNISTATVDDLDRKGHLHRLKSFDGVRYGLPEIERIITDGKVIKTVREKELEKEVKSRDERIEELTRLIIDLRIIGRNARGTE